MQRVEQEQMRVNNYLLDVLATPGGIHIERNKMIIGEEVSKVYIINSFPTECFTGWLSDITNIPGLQVMVDVLPLYSSVFMEAVSRRMNIDIGIRENSKSFIERNRANQRIKDAETTIKNVDEKNEKFCIVSVYIKVSAKDEERLNRKCSELESKLSALNFKVRNLANLTLLAFKSIAPFYTPDKLMGKISKRNMPMSTIAGGFIQARSGYNPGKGFVLGRDENGELIILDIFGLGDDIQNANLVCIGTSGSGKSFTLKHIATQLYALNVRLIFIDAEVEYKKLTKSLNGNWVNTGGGEGGRINPLQIRVLPKDDDMEEEDKGLGDYPLHFQFLRSFFKMYFADLTDLQLAILEKTLEELYKKFNITKDTDITTLKNTDFPILRDLYDYIEEKSKIEIENAQHYSVLLSLLYPIAKGSQETVWNGYTSVTTSSKCICLDTSDLQNGDERMKKAQYYNILTWCWQEIARNRDEKVVLGCDEAHLMVDPQVPQALQFLKSAIKRARKYNSGIFVATQSVNDFLDEKVRLYGQAILDNATNVIIMGADAQNIKDIKSLYDATDAEEIVITSKTRGKAVIRIGRQKYIAYIEAPPEEASLFEETIEEKKLKKLKKGG